MNLRGIAESVEEELTREIIAAAIEVHKGAGPGLLESAYEQCLYYELSQRGFQVVRQMALPLRYKEVLLDIGYRVDILVKRIVLELKAENA